MAKRIEPPHLGRMDAITRLNAALEGRYHIERELGEGGMATVYLAEDPRHERQVALKVLKPELAAALGAERFLTEIKTTANLQHPHILPLHDSGEADGFLFYVMPYIQGETLRDRLEREQQLPVDEAVRIATDVAEALHSAHEHGVIHRDIKPANILMSQGRPLVADFGIAIAVSAAGGGRLTETGLSMGTPYYMSPEQASADREPSASSDVYSLGCVLYEMLVGEPPHTGSSAQAVLAKILMGDAPTPTATRASIPANVDATVRKALEKLPADRFRTASEFVAALGDSGFRHATSAKVEAHATVAGGRAGPGKGLTIGLAALATIFALAFGWSLLRLSAPEPAEPVSRQVLSVEGWAGLVPDFGRYAAIAPDGSSMVVPMATSGGQALGLKRRGSTEVTLIPDTERAQDVIYAPDGQWITYVIGSELLKRPLVGGSALRLAEDAAGSGRVGIAWLDDGTILYDVGAAIVQIPEDGGQPLGSVEIPQVTWVHGLPGASGALVVNGTDATLYAVDLGDLSSEVILEDVIRAWYVPTGHVVYVRGDGGVLAQPFDLGSLTLTDGAVPLFDGVRLDPFAADMRLAADGTLLYVEGRAVGGASESQLAVMDLSGDTEALGLAPRQIGALSVGWSPDGVSIVFESEGQIYTYNTVLNTTPRQLTFDGINASPVFSPDGTRVGFSSARDGTDGFDLFVKNLNDDAPPRPIITLDANQFMMGWPADTLIVFERSEGGVGDLWMADISAPGDPKARSYLTSEADLQRITVSPDGTLAAYRSDESGQEALYVRSFPAPGEGTMVYAGDGAGLSWSPDGGVLHAFTGSNGPVISIRLQRDPAPVVLGVDTLFNSPAWASEPAVGSVLHPDGDRFIVASDPSAASSDEFRQPERLILVMNFFEELQRLVPN
jgi:serine/threonine-protein kinase